MMRKQVNAYKYLMHNTYYVLNKCYLYYNPFTYFGFQFLASQCLMVLTSFIQQMFIEWYLVHESLEIHIKQIKLPELIEFISQFKRKKKVCINKIMAVSDWENEKFKG